MALNSVFFLPENVEIREVSHEVGLGVFSKESHKLLRSTVFVDPVPIASMQHVANKTVSYSCHNCHRSIGGVASQVSNLFNDDRFVEVQSLCGMLSPPSEPVVDCPCGVVYCSEACKEAAWCSHHRFFCVAEEPDTVESNLARFKYYCLGVAGCGDTLLLAGQVMCHFVVKADGCENKLDQIVREFLSFKHLDFLEVSLPPKIDDPEAVLNFKAWLGETVEEAYELLKAALSHKDPLFEMLFRLGGVGLYRKILGIFEWNIVDISIPNDFVTRFFLEKSSAASCEEEQALMARIFKEKEVMLKCREIMGADISGDLFNDDSEDLSTDEGVDEIEEDHEHDDGGLYEEALSQIDEKFAQNPSSFYPTLDEEWWPKFSGTGLFQTVSRLNHSCRPNISIEFPSGTFCAEGILVREVLAGEELTISYVNENLPVEKRRKKLKDFFGFDCMCEKCLEELQ